MSKTFSDELQQQGTGMKRTPRILPACLVLLSLMTACSGPETHILKINVTNDLGSPAKLALCEDYLHCITISDQWTEKEIGAHDTESFVMSTEAATVFRVSSEINGKARVNCLRVKFDKSLKASPNLFLSAATGC